MYLIIMVRRREILWKILSNNLRTAIFAITSACNCKCKMCNMHEQKPESINLNDAQKVLDFLSDNSFLISYFTGGEPTLHPHIVDIVDYANDLGLVTSITTNGTLCKEKLKELKDAGLYMLSVSLDHYDPHICEEIRGFKGIFEREINIIKYAKELGIKYYPLTYLNPLFLEDNSELEKMIDFVNNDLGAPFSFCYPTRTYNTTYKLGGIEKLGDVQKETKAMKRILQKIRNGSTVMNPISYIEDTIKFNEGEEVKYSCKGGEDVCYIDWYGDFYPCFIKKKLFNILKDQPKIQKNVECNECLINCFREPSILSQICNPRHVLSEVSNIKNYGFTPSLYI